MAGLLRGWRHPGSTRDLKGAAPMSDENLMCALRAVDAVDVQDAPKQHRLRTTHCPPLTRVEVAVRGLEA
jgi:hypothetical protein